MILLSAALASEPEVHVPMDWQGHPAMHIPWDFFFAKGLTDRTPRLTWRHTLTQQVYRPYLDESGVRLFLVAAMAEEAASRPEQARRMVLEQIAYVDAFAAEHPDHYAVARSPEEARALLATTDKMVLVHSIEGGHFLVDGAADARFWADQGVALVTLIHLRDDEFGGSAILPGETGRLINPRGARHRRSGDRRGLTDRGKAAIVELSDAGVLVDLAHMTRDALADALAVTRDHGIPPVITHGSLTSLVDGDGGTSEDQLVEIYRQGGQFALGLSPKGLEPVRPSVPVPEHCAGTLDTFVLHHARVQRVIRDRAAEILGIPWEEATPEQRTRLAVGWSSDWNGWLSHAKPKRRCGTPPASPLPIDEVGLAHPGMLPQFWQRVSEGGLELDPMWRSSERFLQLWAQARERR